MRETNCTGGRCLRGAAFLIGALAVPPALAAQRCDSLSTRTSLGLASGDSIAAVEIVTSPPRFPMGSRAASLLHFTTRPSTIRRELLFAAGDTVDSLRIAESLRRLRQLRILEDAVLRVRRCRSGDRLLVRLSVETRDAWSERPVVRIRSTGSTVGVSESNLLGTGRSVRLAVLGTGSRLGFAESIRDPALPGRLASGEVGVSQFADGSQLFLDLRSRAHGLADAWTAEGMAFESEREPRSLPTDQFTRAGSWFLIGRRLGRWNGDDAPPSHADYLLAGAETQRADLTSRSAASMLGPAAVHRKYAGVNIGFARVSTRFEPVTWILPDERIADLPRGVEAEVVAGRGRDEAARLPASRLDAWLGGTWLPRASSVVMADAWVTSFGGDATSGGSDLRAALQLLRPAANGLWIARVAGEQLHNPDPDIRALAMFDPTTALRSPATGFAEVALSASLERSARLTAATRGYSLDAVGVAAMSRRWDPVSGGAEAPPATLVAAGIGLRLTPTHIERATVQLQLLYPMIPSAGLARTPRLALTVQPWLLAGRHRPGRDP
jgi:hypothetical protein